MRKFLILIVFSTLLISCDSVEVSIVSPSVTQADKILAKGLTHAENIQEANKLSDPVFASAVVQELNNRNAQSEINRLDLENEKKYAQEVVVSNDKSLFTASKLISFNNRGLLSNLEVATDEEEFFLTGSKNSDGLITHKLRLSIKYTSNKRRNYLSVNYCDDWLRCDGSPVEVLQISSSAYNCSASDCSYLEVIELSLSDVFLRKNASKGFDLKFNSKRESNTINIPYSYLKGYLSIAS
jgi:hypothetical protein